jgi:hypothetical protein
VSDPDDRWNLAIEMSDVLASCIFDAQDWAEKLVNGSLGEWCPNTSTKIRKFWGKLLAKMKSEFVPVIRI